MLAVQQGSPHAACDSVLAALPRCQGRAKPRPVEGHVGPRWGQSGRGLTGSEGPPPRPSRTRSPGVT